MPAGGGPSRSKRSSSFRIISIASGRLRQETEDLSGVKGSKGVKALIGLSHARITLYEWQLLCVIPIYLAVLLGRFLWPSPCGETNRTAKCLLDRGDAFVIAKAGKPLVKVVPLEDKDSVPQGRLGFMEGEISVPDDFDRMGSREIEGMFMGEGNEPAS